MKIHEISLAILLVIAVLFIMIFPKKTEQTPVTYPSDFIITKPLFTGLHGENHIQGIAVDEDNGFIYYSFSTKLVKCDSKGRVIGSVSGLFGHLGCIAFNEEDGRVYGSLEYKHDSVADNLLENSNVSAEYSDAFYIVSFDADRINETEISAENNDIMTAVHLDEVLEDYNGYGEKADGSQTLHKYGCSGIDGICFAPLPGDMGGKNYLYVGYGIYSDLNRNDNDHQILLCYDIDELKSYEEPLSQESQHRSGPDGYVDKFFVYTGNTTYGVQNLTYDAHSGAMFMAVYKGKKDSFENFDVYAVDMTKSAVECDLTGLDETASALTLFGSDAPESETIKGWEIPFGQCGISSKGDGSFYVAEQIVINESNAAYVCIYNFSPEIGFYKSSGFEYSVVVCETEVKKV